jgi:caa(3)-type oxidase subunit IV
MENLSQKYTRIWLMLMGLVVLAVALRVASLPPRLNAGLVFSIALFKAYWVVQDFMHFRSEGWLPRLALASPILLLVGVIVACSPDLAWVSSTTAFLK